MARIRLVDAQGNPVEAEENELQGVLEQGLAGFDKVVQLTGADGKRYEADAADVPSMLQDRTHRLTNVDEMNREAELKQADEGLTNNLDAQGFALMRGATFGQSDRFFTGIGAEGTKERIALLQEANADETGATEFAGSIIPSLGLAAATGGVSLGAQVLGATGARALGQGLIQGVAGAADTALRIVNQDWLTDQEISAERVMAGAGEGFLLGALFGGAAEAVVPGMRKLAEGTTRALSPDNAADLAVDAITGGYSKAEKGVILRGFDGPEGRVRLGNIIQSENVLGKSSAESLKNVNARLEEIGGDLGAAYRQIDAEGVQLDLKGLRASLFEHAKTLEDIAPELATSVRSRVQGLADSLFDTKGISKAMDDLKADELWIDLGSSPSARKAAARMKKIENLDPMEHDIAGKLYADVAPLLKEAPDELQAAFREHIAKVQDAQGAASGKQLSVSEAWELRKQFDELRQTFDPTNVPARKAVGEARDDFMRAFFDDLKGKAPPEMVENISSLGMRYKGLSAAEEGLTRQAQAVVKRAGDFGIGSAGVGAIAGSVLGGPGGGPAGALFGAAIQAGQVFAKDSVKQLAPRMVGWASKAEQGFSSMIERMVKAAPGEAAAAVGAVRRSIPRALSNMDIETRRQQLEEAAKEDSPQAAAAHALDPAMGPAVATQQARVAEYLLTKLPQGKDPTRDIWAKFDGPHFSEADRRAYARIERAAIDPTAVIQDVIEGRARPEELETIKQLYPRLMDRARAQLEASIAGMSDKPSASQRRAVERFMGVAQSAPYRTFIQESARKARANSTPQPKQDPSGVPVSGSLGGYSNVGSPTDNLQAGIGQQ